MRRSSATKPTRELKSVSTPSNLVPTSEIRDTFLFDTPKRALRPRRTRDDGMHNDCLSISCLVRGYPSYARCWTMKNCNSIPAFARLETITLHARFTRFPRTFLKLLSTYARSIRSTPDLSATLSSNSEVPVMLRMPTTICMLLGFRITARFLTRALSRHGRKFEGSRLSIQVRIAGILSVYLAFD